MLLNFSQTVVWHSGAMIKIDSQTNGNFLGITELISQCVPFLAEHLAHVFVRIETDLSTLLVRRGGLTVLVCFSSSRRDDFDKLAVVLLTKLFT